MCNNVIMENRVCYLEISNLHIVNASKLYQFFQPIFRLVLFPHAPLLIIKLISNQIASLHILTFIMNDKQLNDKIGRS